MPKLIKKLSILSIISLTAALSLSGIAYASHKTNNPSYDIAAHGVNYHGYRSIARCEAYNSGSSCSMLVEDCDGYAEVYATDLVIKRIIQKIREGQKMPVHTMSSTGHFIDKVCTLSVVN